MIRKVLFWLLLVPLAIVILMFAVANRELVTVSFDPFNETMPAASVSVPLFILIFLLVILGVIIGGSAAWLRQSGYRRAARQHDAEMAALRREIETLNRRLDERLDLPAAGEASRLAYRPASNG